MWFSSILHRFRVICDYSLQWDFLYSAPQNGVFGHPIPPTMDRFQFGPHNSPEGRGVCRSSAQFGPTLRTSVRCRISDIFHNLRILGSHVTSFHGNHAMVTNIFLKAWPRLSISGLHDFFPYLAPFSSYLRVWFTMGFSYRGGNFTPFWALPTKIIIT